MSINRDEALRAKDMAEILMRKADFSGAQRLVSRAQKLDSSLDNISHMMMVCDVHCAAAEKLSGNDKNWYGILQVEQKADDIAIKKQYKKLALLLHPDKNKLPGAEAAFKLIGEAQSILLDKDKRSLHDMKRRTVNRPATAPSYRPQQPPTYYTQPVFPTSNFRNNFTAFRPENQQQQQKAQAQPAGFCSGTSFWTSCPFCHMRYEYARVHINKLIDCQSCRRQFTTFEVPCQGDPRAKSADKKPFSFPQPKGMGQATSGAENISRKRKRRKIIDSSESSDSTSSSESEEDIVIGKNGNVMAGEGLGSVEGQRPRRSVRSKRQVSYKENLSDEDDDFVNLNQEGSEEAADVEGSELPEQPCEGGSSNGTSPNGINKSKKSKDKENGQMGTSAGNSGSPNSKKDSSSESLEEPKIMEYADPDFHDFDELRKEHKFAVGQIWAVYDTNDGMPRFYACVRKVFTAGFKLKITWLEAEEPDDELGISWVQAGLPVGVGKFVFGNTETTMDRPMFSHMINCVEGRNKKHPLRVLPRKGETWALFKNWNTNWSADPDSHYEYEFAEILSEYSETAGVAVAFLYKVKGFSSVFCRTVEGGSETTLHVPPHELYRFSHSVPSFILTGKERDGVPEGSYELDPAALPENIEEISVPAPPNAASASTGGIKANINSPRSSISGAKML